MYERCQRGVLIVLQQYIFSEEVHSDADNCRRTKLLRMNNADPQCLLLKDNVCSKVFEESILINSLQLLNNYKRF